MPILLARLFMMGGWIPMLAVVLWGCWHLWVQSRQRKFAATISTCVLAIDVPRQNEQTAKAAEQIFSILAGAYSGLDSYEKYWLGKFQPFFSFEIVSINGYVQFCVHTWNKYRDLVEAAIYGQYPDAEIVEIADYTGGIPSHYPHPEWDVFGTEFVLKRPSHLPIRTYFQFEHTAAEYFFKDPLAPLLEALGSLKKNEQLWFQIMVRPTGGDWRDDCSKAVDKMLGKKKVSKPSPIAAVVDGLLSWPIAILNEILGSEIMLGGSAAAPAKDDSLKMLALSPGERSVIEAAQMKMGKIGFETKIRFVYAARKDVFSKGRSNAVKGALMQFAAHDMNEFKNYGKVTPKSDYFWQRWSEPVKKMSIVRNFRGRSSSGATPFILNIEELATMFHFPMSDIKTPLLKKTQAKKSEPPAGLPVEGEQPASFFKPKGSEDSVKPKPPSGAPPADLPLDE